MKLILFALAAICAPNLYAQCGKLKLNPDTGQLDCTGPAGATGNAASVVTSTFSVTPTFTCPSATAGTVTVFKLSTTLTADVTSSTLASCTTGQTLNFVIQQDATGGRTFAWPTGFSQACTVSPIASAITKASFAWDGTTAQLLSCAADLGPLIFSSEAAAPGTPPAGTVYCWMDSTDHSGLECKANGSANVYKMLLNGSASGTAGAPLFVQNQSVTVTNTTTETSLDGTVASGGSKTIPANWFSAAGSVLDVCYGGYLSADAAVPGTLRLKLKFGSTVLADTGATTLPAAIPANTVLSGCVRISARTVGASGTLIANNDVGFSQAIAGLGLGFLATSAVTIDTTATQALTFTVQWGTADSDNTVTLTNLWAASPGSAVSSVNGATGGVVITVTAGNGVSVSGGTGTTPTVSTTTAVLDGSVHYGGASAAGTDTYAATLSPVPAGYVTGAMYRFKADVANTGAATINFNSLGAKTIKKATGGVTTDLATNDILANQMVDSVYDGTNMQMQSTLGNAASGSGTVTVVGAGSLTSTALVTGGGTTTVQTPSATATLNSSGNISTPGGVTTGAGGSVGGALELGQGSAPSAGTTSIKLYAPAAVTSHTRRYAGVAYTGIPFYTNTAGDMVETSQSLGTGVGTFLGTPSSANLAAAVTDETGSGAAVFGTSPTLTTPVLGVAAATSINKVAITTPATSATLTIIDGKTLTVNKSITLEGTDSTTMTFPATTATLARIDAANTFTGTQTFNTAIAGTSGGTGQSTYTKGDILASPGSNTLNKLGVGTDGQVLTADAASTNGIKWAAGGGGSSIDPSTTLFLADDFGCGAFTSGTVGCLGWFLSASGFSSAAANAIAGSPGLQTLTTSGTINSVVGIAPIATASNLAAAETFLIRTKIASITGTAPTTNIRLRIGLTTQYSTPDSITNGMYLEKLEGDTNWFCVTRAASSETRADTSVAFSASAFAVQIRRVDSTHIGCKVASTLSGLTGATEVSNTATIPTTDMNPFIMVKNTAAELKLLNIDYWDMTISGLTR